MAVHTRSEFELTATGDAMLTRPVEPYEGVSARFDGMVSLLRESDTAVTNLEVLIHDYEDGAYPTRSLGTFMRAPALVLDELRGMGFDCVTTATNHSFDYGYGGIEQTMAALEERSFPYAGLGRDLFEARKPAYVETPAGRVALLSTCTTINPGSEARHRSRTMDGSPGINPLRRERIYRLPPAEIEALEQISERLNFEEIKAEWLERGIYGAHDWTDESYFHFMDMKFEEVDDPSEAGIYDELVESDRSAVLEWVEEAAEMADWVVVGVHCHESPLGYHNKPETPAFLREFAHDCVDAGANALVGHGPHILRGIEIYEGAPLFYSLGNFVDQREFIERLPPEQYRRHDLEDPTKVSAVFDSRSLDEDGNLKADFANPWWFRSVIPRCRFSGDEVETVELHPISLQQHAGRPGRGFPVLAEGEAVRETIDRLRTLSEPWGTEITEENGRVLVTG